MFAKVAIISCVLAIANAGYIPAQYTIASPTLTSTSDNILRTPGNLAQIASQSKTISTPFSSSSRSDVRISNPAVYAHAAPIATHYAAPIATAHYAQPVAAAPAPSLLGVAYSPAVAVSHMTYSSPIGISYSW